MTPTMILFVIGAAVIGPVVIYIAAARNRVGSPALAAALSAGFAAFTAVTIAAEGVWPVIVNHSTNLWGIQVWYDLLISVGTALFLVMPRARAAGMQVWPWVVFVALTASIGLLAMVARLFWLERAAAGAGAPK